MLSFFIFQIKVAVVINDPPPASVCRNEGFPECEQPVNDCLRGLDECSPYAACINLQGLDEFGNG